jgi:hypothetical protein
MSKYLDRLKGKKQAPDALPKLTKEASVSFVSAGGGRSEKTHTPSVSFGSDRGGHFQKIDTADIPVDCVGALQSHGGGLYLPWGAVLTQAEVFTLQADLTRMIEELAALERWEGSDLNDVLERAWRGPLSDLLPNTHYFEERLRKIHQDGT